MAISTNSLWDLNLIISPQAGTDAFDALVCDIDSDLQTACRKLRTLGIPCLVGQSQPLVNLLNLALELETKLEQLQSIRLYLSHRDVTDSRCGSLSVAVSELLVNFTSLSHELDGLLGRMPESVLDEIITKVDTPMSFWLLERRATASPSLTPGIAAVITDYAGAASKSWFQIRQHLINRTKVRIEQNNSVDELTLKQAFHQLFVSHPDTVYRKKLARETERALQPDIELHAKVLNEIMGLRVKTDGYYGYSDALEQTLSVNRVSPRTLSAMGQAIKQSMPHFSRYFHHKARLLGLEKLGEEDLLAPVTNGNSMHIPFSDAIQMICESLGAFHPGMRGFVDKALERNWIDSEVRETKSSTHLCCRFPVSKESRILTTYRGNYAYVSLLAHELGHAYHFDQLYSLPGFAGHIPTSMTEIASTFSEFIVTRRILRETSSETARIHMLNETINNTFRYVIKPYINFLFEQHLYNTRRTKTMTAHELNEMMNGIQKAIYQDALDTYAPSQWVSNNLFYLASRPFYNYQYALGYLFSAGIYALAITKGSISPKAYDAFLRDSGAMTVEELALKHFHIDITQDSFWFTAMTVLGSDIDTVLQEPVEQ